MQAEITLFEKYGGKAGMSAVADRFYQKVLADSRINHFFTQTDMERQRGHMTAFLAFALGGPVYSGRSMERAHAGLNLQPEHFNAVAENMVSTLQEVGVTESDLRGIVARLLSLKESVLYK